MARRTKVLIVEDELIIAANLQLAFQNLGMDVLDPVVMGQEAVQVAIKEQPDIIFMDIRLVGTMDGIEAATKIHSLKNIPVVFMSGYATEYMMERAQKAHPIDFLEKPVDIKKIKTIIDCLKETN